MKTFDINEIQLTIQSPHVKLEEELNDYIISQVEKLGKINNRMLRFEMMLHIVKNNKDKNCEVEAKLFIPGKTIFAIDKQDNFKVAVKMVFDDLQDQLYKIKEKISTRTGIE